MADYSYAQLEQLWINAGGPRHLAPVAAAIAEAESGGNSDALNPNDNNGTQSSFGLWQISTGTHAPPSPNWADPATNARLAVGKWKGAGQSFTPWGTFDSGAYRAYLNNKTTPDPNVPGSGTAHATETAASTSATGPGGPCIIALPSLPIIGSLGCLFSKSEARALIGAGILLAGGLLGLAGLGTLMAAVGLRAAGPLGTAAEVAGSGLLLVPGAEGVGAGMIAAGHEGKKIGKEGASKRIQARHERRQKREEKDELSERRAARSQTAGGLPASAQT